MSGFRSTPTRGSSGFSTDEESNSNRHFSAIGGIGSSTWRSPQRHIGGRQNSLTSASFAHTATLLGGESSSSNSYYYGSGTEDQSSPLIRTGPSAHSSIQNFSTAARQRFITPRDEHSAVCLSFLLLGAGFLFPWNAIITAGDYWNLLYAEPKGTFFLFTMAYMIANFLGLALMVNFGSRLSFGQRIVPGFVLFIAAIMAITFIENPYAAIGICGFLGFLDSIVQGSVYGLAGQFHPRFVGAVMAGNGVAGTVIAFLRVFTKIGFANDLSGQFVSAIIYFSVASAALVICIISYVFVIGRSPVTKYYLEKATRSMRTNYVTGTTSNAPVQEYSIAEVTRMVSGPASQVFLNFWVTLSLFPGLIFTLRSDTPALNNGLWFNTILVTLFNIFDLVGRTIVRWDALVVFNRNTLWFLTIGRLLFIPAIILSLPGTSFQVFENDFWQYVFIILFALSNGYQATLCMMFGPAVVPPASKERAGTIMVFFMTGGLTLGVISGTLINDFIAYHSPLPPL